MLEAPDGATFVWVNGHIDYPKRLYRKLKDQKLLPETHRLYIVSREALSFGAHRLRGVNGPVILDHAIGIYDRITDGERDGLDCVRYINERFAHDQKIASL